MEASRSWEVTAALWDGRGTACRLAPAHTTGPSQSKKKKKKLTCHHADVSVKTVSANANHVFMSHHHVLHKHGLRVALHSPLIVFVVSGLGLLLIPCGAFGCSVITLNGFHTVATRGCVCVCFGLCLCVAAGAHTCQE